MSYKNVLLTGSLGYIGSEIALALKGAGISYTPVDMRAGENDHIVLNLADHKATKILIDEVRPTMVLHCATHSALRYKNDFFTAFKEDFDATHSLLSALHDLPKCRVVYFSSSYVYSGISRDKNVGENTMLLPKHNFGIGKMFFEQYLLKNHSASVIFRLSSVFGNGPSQHPNAILALVKEAEETAQITIWGKGERMMQYVYLPDVVRTVLSVEKLPPGIYNLGGNEYTAIANAAGAIAKVFGVKLVFLQNKHEGETLPFMQTDKIRTALSSNRLTPFNEALRKYITKIKSQNEKITL